MSEIAYSNNMEGNIRLEMNKTGLRTYVDEHQVMQQENVVREFIEKYIKPELGEKVVVSRDPNDLENKDARNFMNMIYSFASNFGLSAKISNTGEGCLYSFWYDDD